MQSMAGMGKHHLFAAKTQQLFYVFFLFCFLSSVSGKMFFSEKMALLEFKSSLYDSSGLLSSWRLHSLSHCSWSGVSCDSNSRVLSIEITGGPVIGGNNPFSPSCSNSNVTFFGFGIRRNCSDRNGKLSGTLSRVIGKFTELKVLSLPFHELTGEIPSEIWVLKKLEVLDLEGNLILGNLPHEFTGLRKLHVLNLGFNGISGVIPDSLSKCRSLRVLNLAGNQLNGTIPGFVNSFSMLKGLYLSFNRLIGPIPDNWGNNCRNLQHIDLSGNVLNGKIPRSLGNCSRLRTVLLFSNILDGVIPHELGRLRRLEVLDVSRNTLGGPIPANLGNCVELSVLVLSSLFNPMLNSGKTCGEVSCGYAMSSSARDEYNHFQGSVPMEITTLPKLKIIWAPNANLKGKFPSSWGHCGSLEMVNLAHNFLTEDISGVFGGCKNLHFLNLSSNRLTGELSEELPVPCMTVFDVSENRISGSIPSFCNCSCPRISSSSSSLIQSYDQSFPYLSFFTYKTLFENPFLFSNTGFLVIHNFGRNNFTGPIPLLPISSEGLGKQIDYVFLAGRNKLNGSFPNNFFGKCDGLNGLIVNVSNNNISGHIPFETGVMCRSLKLLDASKNLISGSIPRSFVQSRNLTLLLLNYKPIPLDLANVKSLDTFNVSYNNLSGSFLFNNGVMNCSSFLGNPFRSPNCPSVSLTLPLAEKYTASPLESDSERRNRISSIEIALIVSALAIVVILLTLIFLFFYARKRLKNSQIQVSEPSASGMREITVFNDIGVHLEFENVVQATGNFNASNCIGSGGFGSTYKAEIVPGTFLAVKRLTIERCQGVPQFHAEIRTLGRIKHPNLITLIGYYASEAEMFLIYNFLPGGNLLKFIQEKERRAVGWDLLYKIALDIANALDYLHNQCNPRVVHRDVKPSNILLDDEFNAYLSDFGLSRLLGTFETHATTGVAGTFGYVAPEYALTCRVSEKADVYSYGVVLLELISNKKALDPSFSSHGNGFNIVSWASMLMRQGQAREVFTASLWDAGPHDNMVNVLHLAIMCTIESLSTRPTMRQVVQQLKQLQPPLQGSNIKGVQTCNLAPSP